MIRSLSLTFGVFIGLASAALAQTVSGYRVEPIALGAHTYKLSATVKGKEMKLASNARKVWRVESGGAVVWSATDGAGGYENEGESLWRFEAATSKSRKLMAEYFAVHTVREAKTKSGRTLYVVTMFDGGLGAPHLTVVDPKRGQVWRQSTARLADIRNGRIAVALLRSKDIEDSSPEAIAKIKPRKMVYLSLDALRKRRVIRLERDRAWEKRFD